jgi:hypothetical protein
MRSLRTALCIWVFALLPGFEAAGTPQTFLILNSQPGDYMGQGNIRCLRRRMERFRRNQSIVAVWIN